jgi:hypothetical protein
MCRGQKRLALRSAPIPAPKTLSVRQDVSKVSSSLPQPLRAADPPPRSPVSLRYLETSPIQVQGPVTGRQYEFSGARPVQIVDARDAAALVRTRFFRQSG